MSADLHIRGWASTYNVYRTRAAGLSNGEARLEPMCLISEAKAAIEAARKNTMNLFNNFQAMGDVPGPTPSTPDVLPPSIRDVNAAFDTGVEFDLNTPLADGCPNCGAFNMVVGDYMYLGACVPCTHKAQAE